MSGRQPLRIRMREARKRHLDQEVLESPTTATSETAGKKIKKTGAKITPSATRTKSNSIPTSKGLGKSSKQVKTDDKTEEPQNLLDYLNLSSDINAVKTKNVDDNLIPVENTPSNVVEKHIKSKAAEKNEKKCQSKTDGLLLPVRCYICPNCPETFSNKTLLLIHFQTIHKGKINLKKIKTEFKPYLKCLKCSLKLFNEFQLEKHKKICHSFQLQVKGKDQIKFNMIVSNQDSDFACNHCAENFDDKPQLDGHKEKCNFEPTLEDKSIYFCPTCKLSFAKKNEFRHHSSNCRSSVIMLKSDGNREFTIINSNPDLLSESDVETVDLEAPSKPIDQSKVPEAGTHVTVQSANTSFLQLTTGTEPPSSSLSGIKTQGNKNCENDDIGDFVWESTKIDPTLCAAVISISSNRLVNQPSASKLQVSSVPDVYTADEAAGPSTLDTTSTVNSDFFTNVNPMVRMRNYSTGDLNMTKTVVILKNTSTPPQSSTSHTYNSRSNPVLIYKPNQKPTTTEVTEINRSDELKIAWQQIYSRNVKCVRCNLFFNNHKLLNIHLDEVHESELNELKVMFNDRKGSPLAFQCGNCPSRFATNLLLRKHWRECKQKEVNLDDLQMSPPRRNAKSNSMSPRMRQAGSCPIKLMRNNEEAKKKKKNDRYF